MYVDLPPPVRERTVFHPWGVEISMSPENHGVPEDDDPFAYLYRGDGADGGSGQTPETAPLPGVPRTSYHQATQVGRTQYGQPQQQAQQAPPGYQAQPRLPHQDQPTAQYRAGEPSYQSAPYKAAPAAAPTPPPGGGRAGARAGGSGGRGGSRGVMFGAIAVGIAVVVIIAVVAFNSGPDKSNKAGAGSSSSAPAVAPPATSASDTPSVAPTTGTVDPVDAGTMVMTGGAKTNTDHKGALSAGGSFVDGMTTPGATVTWTVNAPAAGSYFLWVRYANATGKDSGATVTVNQKTSGARTIGLKDYGSKGSWDSWFSSYSGVTLQKGQNTIAVSCTAAAACNFNLDQMALTPPTDSSSRPSAWK
ncbi:carbohydrate-binding protein [Streptacidiphilus sp. N1-3]|uniref:Carbohydrate-binding protein n=1 Tax=Streptacidiphilus alkalitolerans TaxID=3342712 RepID=A0ABV6X543_9ACTN